MLTTPIHEATTQHLKVVHKRARPLHSLTHSLTRPLTYTTHETTPHTQLQHWWMIALTDETSEVGLITLIRESEVVFSFPNESFGQTFG